MASQESRNSGVFDRIDANGKLQSLENKIKEKNIAFITFDVANAIGMPEISGNELSDWDSANKNRQQMYQFKPNDGHI